VSPARAGCRTEFIPHQRKIPLEYTGERRIYSFEDHLGVAGYGGEQSVALPFLVTLRRNDITAGASLSDQELAFRPCSIIAASLSGKRIVNV
jgi:hypothetical protein